MSDEFYKPPFMGDVSELISPARFIIYMLPTSLLFLLAVYVEFHESKLRGVAIQLFVLRFLLQIIAFGIVGLVVQLRRVLLIFDENATIDQDGIIEKFFSIMKAYLLFGIYIFLSFQYKVHYFFIIYSVSIFAISFFAAERFQGWLDIGEELSGVEKFSFLLSVLSIISILLFALKIATLKV